MPIDSGLIIVCIQKNKMATKAKKNFNLKIFNLKILF